MAKSEFTPRRWTPQQLVRAAYLSGAGKTCEEIAKDPLIKSTASSVRMHLNSNGLRADNPEMVSVSLTGDISALEDAARRRRLAVPQLLTRVFEILDKEPDLIDALLGKIEK